MPALAELFGAKSDVLLYDLTSTYFETDIYVLAQSDARTDKERGMHRFVDRLHA